MMDLYNVSASSNIWMTLLTAYLLGVVHGITPDEHTWPITFSYSLGSYSAKKGFLIGLFLWLLHSKELLPANLLIFH